MTAHDAELLDAALNQSTELSLSDELRALTDLAIDVGNALRGAALSQEQRDALYARVLDLGQRRGAFARLGWRLPALIGGSIVTAGAVAAITVALTRGRRHTRLPLPA
jgi:hypothetical protein